MNNGNDANFFNVTTSSFSEESSSQKQSGNSHKKIQKRKKKKNQNRQGKKYHVKASFLYHPGVELANIESLVNSHVEVRVDKHYLLHSRPGPVFGSDQYHSSSDLLGVFRHSNCVPWKDLCQRDFKLLRFVISVSKLKKSYIGKYRNGWLSEKLNPAKGFTIKVVSYRFQQQVDLLAILPEQQIFKYRSTAR